MDLMPEQTRVGYKEIAELLGKLTEETSKLEVHQKKISEHNHALGNLNRSFNQAQTRLERVAAAKCGDGLLNL
ncbi:hypothetical protein SKAU_G00325110 [Synaphobranchus kaupii]|uniref:Uncharacterized protein n=1 Tax=Synaphobranchus kaupii TaxID=118154 RepID=A0A9Q1II19_SYNKA|nr:hypothetical protein SKAU_G00325110 [Synaphobranchus kaupii]